MSVTFQDIQNSVEIRTYITQADASLIALGFTEHSFAHVGRCANVAARILNELGYPAREVELARIAAFMHDIGNVVNRHDHAISGATMAFRILDKMGMEPAEVATVITAIGHHDDSTAFPVNAVAAALILADKTDVRRSRVRNNDVINFDIHDRVNYAVERSEVLPWTTLRSSFSVWCCAVKRRSSFTFSSIWKSTGRFCCNSFFPAAAYEAAAFSFSPSILLPTVTTL